MLAEKINTIEIFEFIESERMKMYKACFKFGISSAPNYNYFKEIKNYISPRDELEITLHDEADNTMTLFTVDGLEENYNDFIKNLLLDELVDVKIEICKKIENNILSIYSIEKFSEDIIALSTEDILNAFANLYRESSSFLIFDVFEDINIFTTKTMFFIPHGSQLTEPTFNRTKRIDDCKMVSYFYNLDNYEVIPDDFKIEVNFQNNPLTALFHRITILLSLCFIASSSSICEHEVKGIINGQRTIEFCYIEDQIPVSNHLYDIYNWIYTDGSPVDKAIIARNVISLHCKYSSIVDVDESIMASIQSNYNLYLKDNVTQYIELKNNIATFICEIVSKTGEYAYELLNKFKTNLLAIFAFIFTVILANIVSDQPLDSIFTRDITVLVETILIGSLIYLVICLRQSKFESDKVYKSYELLKMNYTNILSTDDINDIFKDDFPINDMNKTISRKRKFYVFIWVVFLIISLFIVEMLSTSPTYKTVFKIFENFISFIQKSK